MKPNQFLKGVLKRAVINNDETGEIIGSNDYGKYLVRLDSGTTKWVYSQVAVSVGDRVRLGLKDGDINKSEITGKTFGIKSDDPLVVRR
ncbi:MAG: hypothetical protein JW984_15300 [Deltaproteobacteria bacterium]|uniref:Uncharacterized protein n=1 Tax=Candidatus Zymogenus saltonus TaxID=2844893 RepID=A0A9D8PS47_9DELT|nr:hypothetical protein [Candidatus Zymogenus saltonus]